MEPLSSRSNGSSQRLSNPSRKYRRLAAKESSDDTLFGSTPGNRSRQAGRSFFFYLFLIFVARDIVRSSSNQEADAIKPTKVRPTSQISTVLPTDELLRIRVKKILDAVMKNNRHA